jgi:hypothetical protein
MKQFENNLTAAKYILLAAFCTTLFSFSMKKGGDSFEVYLNGKMVFQQYVSMHQGVKSLQLNQSLYNDEVTVYYNHCGKTGTDRVITIKDGENKILKTWHFPNDAANPSAMNCKVKEIMNLQKNSGSNLGLYYASREIPEGRLLATVIIANDSKAVTKATR